MILIGLNGNPKSGKDTIANYLVKEHGFIHLFFADPLKRCVREIFEFTEEELKEENKNKKIERYGKSRRELEQFVGTEIGRNVDSDHWIKHLNIWFRTYFYKYNLLNPEVKDFENVDLKFIITDMRFPNEVVFVKNNGGLCWRVENKNSLDGKTVGIKNHESENTLDPELFDAVVDNNGSLEDLYNNLEKLIGENK